MAYSSRICSKYLYKKKEEKLTLEDQVFRLILRINSSELYSNIYGSASTHMICRPSFLPLHFQVWNSLKMAFWERKLLSLGEKWRFWTGNFCRSGEIRVFLYFQDLASFHHKKNHGSISISRGFIFLSALRSRGFEFISHLPRRVDEIFRQEAFDQASYNLIL